MVINKRRFTVLTANVHSRFMTGADRRTLPVYSIDEASSYLGIPARTLRSWSTGRTKQDKSGDSYPPVLLGVDQHYRRLSFFDLVEAHKWFNLAVIKGMDAAKSYRAELASEMTMEEISAAQKSAREWLAGDSTTH